jgi:hypothetical protein
LYREGKPVDNVVPWKKGINSFFEWMQKNFPGGVILVAHEAFDGKAEQIVDDLKRSGRSDRQIKEVVAGFCDTLPAFRKRFPGLPSF